MKIGKLILRMRQKQANYERRDIEPIFGNFVGGSVDLAAAMNSPAARDLCFVIPLGGSIATQSSNDDSINQLLVERFGVVVCLKVDEANGDNYGIVAYDRLHDIREQVMGAFLGWQVAEAESLIRYRGESLLDYDTAYLWYQFEFEYDARLLCKTIFDETGIDADGEGSADYSEGGIDIQNYQDINVQALTEFEKIYTQIVMTPCDEIPLQPGQGIPIDLTIPKDELWFDKNA
jgi:hypothetical protein